MVKFAVVSEYKDDVSVHETIESALEMIQETLEGDGYAYSASRMKIYPLGEPVPFIVQPSKVTLASYGDIPAPLPGETVSDYARRITGG